MSLVHKIDDVDVSALFEFGTITDLTTAARGGERGGGKIIVTDRTGTQDIHGWHTYTVDETDELLRPRLFTGFIAAKEIDRGPEGPIGAGRVWECDLEDLNILAHMKIFRVAAAKRPAEENLNRIAWMLTTAAVGDAFTDTGYVNDSHPRPFEEADYRKSYPDELLDDLSGVIGRDWFIFWDYDATAAALFYDVRDASTLDSLISINNVAGTANYTTVFPPGSSRDGDDAKITRDHSEVYDGCLMVYAHGQVYRTRAATTAEFFHAPPGGRDVVIENSRIGLEATAILMADSYLEVHSVERDIMTVPLFLPATHVNHVAAGERIDIRLEHEPGYEADYVTLRVARKTVSEAGLGEDGIVMYDVVLECTNAAPEGRGGPGAGGFPLPPPGSPTYVQEKGNAGDQITLDHPITDGHLLTWFVTSRTADIRSITPAGWTMIASCSNLDAGPGSGHFGAAYYKTASGDGSTIGSFAGTSGLNMHVFEWGDGVVIDTAIGSFGSASNLLANTSLAIAITPSATPATVVTGSVQASNDSGAWTFTPGTDVTELYDQPTPGPVSPEAWVGIKTNVTGATSVGGAFTSGFLQAIGGVSYSVHVGGSANPPEPTQPVEGELVTITNGVGATAHPFADGSLHVRYDIIDQTPAIVSYDGACGVFIMPSDPPFGSQVFVDYLGR